jgi:Protein of unknown function (DUF1573)
MLRLPLLLAVLCLCASAQIQPPRTLSPETAYDFETVKQGAKIVHGFTIKNSTALHVSVQAVEFSMPGMTARFRPLIAPGQNGSVVVEWDTSHLAGEIEGQAIVHFADTAQPPIAFRLKGVVEPPLEILPVPAIFLSAFQGEDTERRLRIVNHQAQPIAIALSQASGKHFTASLTELARGKIYEVVTKIPPAVPPGRYDEELSLSTNDSKLARLTIPVHLFVKPNLYANPDVIDFGSVAVEPIRKDPAIQELLTQTFLVKKRGGEFAITKISSDLEALELRRDPPHGNSSTYRIDVALNPQKIKVGKLEGYIQIETDDKDFPEIRVPVAGRVF